MNAVDELITKIYIQGDSYHNIRRFIWMFYQDGISLSTISRITNNLYGKAEEFHRSAITDKYSFLWLEGIYFSVK